VFHVFVCMYIIMIFVQKIVKELYSMMTFYNVDLLLDFYENHEVLYLHGPSKKCPTISFSHGK
jgi:hypothetical protein